jgi:hypothetical protein
MAARRVWYDVFHFSTRSGIIVSSSRHRLAMWSRRSASTCLRVPVNAGKPRSRSPDSLGGFMSEAVLRGRLFDPRRDVAFLGMLCPLGSKPPGAHHTHPAPVRPPRSSSSLGGRDRPRLGLGPAGFKPVRIVPRPHPGPTWAPPGPHPGPARLRRTVHIALPRYLRPCICLRSRG